MVMLLPQHCTFCQPGSEPSVPCPIPQVSFLACLAARERGRRDSCVEAAAGPWLLAGGGAFPGFCSAGRLGKGCCPARSEWDPQQQQAALGHSAGAGLWVGTHDTEKQLLMDNTPCKQQMSHRAMSVWVNWTCPGQLLSAEADGHRTTHACAIKPSCPQEATAASREPKEMGIICTEPF